jgi:fatty-acyl-CoA synthase
MAFVVAKPGQPVNQENIAAFCKDKLARYKIPKYVVLLKELPKNDAGKIDRKKLKELSREFFQSNQH